MCHSGPILHFSLCKSPQMHLQALLQSFHRSLTRRKFNSLLFIFFFFLSFLRRHKEPPHGFQCVAGMCSNILASSRKNKISSTNGSLLVLFRRESNFCVFTPNFTSQKFEPPTLIRLGLKLMIVYGVISVQIILSVNRP